MKSNDISEGDEIYYVDKDRVIYIHGIVDTVTENGVTLQFMDAGPLTIPGYEPGDPEEYSYEKGSQVKDLQSGENRSFLSPREFKALQQSLPQEEPEEEQPEVETAPISEVEDAEEEEKEPTREDVEEGSPEYETEGLELQASLDWPGIIWPQGFPQSWMEVLYENLPEGQAERGFMGEPAIYVPESKGPGLPEGTAKGDKLQEDFDKTSKELQEALNDLKKTEEGISETSDVGEEQIEELSEKRKKATVLRDKLQSIKEQLAGEEGVWRRPPGSRYEKVPKRRAPPPGQLWGRKGLRMEVRELSDKYKESKELIAFVRRLENRIKKQQEELDLILTFRKKKLINEAPEGEAPRYIFEDLERPELSGDEALARLQKLKYIELKRKPYLFSREEREMLAGGEPTPPEFTRRVGKSRTFFDLTPEEVDSLIEKEVDQSGLMDEKEVQKRAEEYAKAYRSFIAEEVGWKKTTTKIQEYLRKKHSLNISEREAERVDKTIREEPEVTISGRNTKTGGPLTVKVSTHELLENVINKLALPFQRRVLWLQTVQDRRRAALAAEKARIKAMLVERDPEVDRRLKSVEKRLRLLIPTAVDFIKVWEKTSTKKRMNLIESDEFHSIHTGLAALVSLLAEVSSQEDVEKFLDSSKINSAKAAADAATAAFKNYDFRGIAKNVAVAQQLISESYKLPLIIDDQKYKEALTETFLKFLPWAQTKEVSEAIGETPSRYQMFQGYQAFQRKKKQLDEKEKEATALAQQIQQLRRGYDLAYEPVLQLEKNLVQLRDKYYQQEASTEEQAHTRKILDVSVGIYRKIKNLINRRGFVRKFYSGRHETSEEAKAELHAIDREINLLNDQRTSVLKELPSTVREQLGDLGDRLESAYSEYKGKVEEVDNKLDQLSKRLGDLQDEQYEMEGEIGLTRR